MCKLHSDGRLDTCDLYKHGIQTLLDHAKSCDSRTVQGSDDIVGQAVKDLMKAMGTMPPSFRGIVNDLMDGWKDSPASVSVECV